MLFWISDVIKPSITSRRTYISLQIEFEYKSLVFHMFDVGGQRSERKKWIHCFDNVDCVLFVVAMSEYDQMLVEDRSVNRMQESLNLFADIVNNEFFKEMPFIVFFNKHDLFKEKVRTKSIRVAFPLYPVSTTFYVICTLQPLQYFISNL